MIAGAELLPVLNPEKPASTNPPQNQAMQRMLTAVENGGAGRSKMVALGCVDLP